MIKKTLASAVATAAVALSITPAMAMDEITSEAAIERLVGAVLVENNEEWMTTRRYMPLEAIAKIGQPHTIEPAALTVANARASTNAGSRWLRTPMGHGRGGRSDRGCGQAVSLP